MSKKTTSGGGGGGGKNSKGLNPLINEDGDSELPFLGGNAPFDSVYKHESNPYAFIYQ
jgi:hypothetical protein